MRQVVKAGPGTTPYAPGPGRIEVTVSADPDRPIVRVESDTGGLWVLWASEAHELADALFEAVEVAAPQERTERGLAADWHDDDAPDHH